MSVHPRLIGSLQQTNPSKMIQEMKATPPSPGLGHLAELGRTCSSTPRSGYHKPVDWKGMQKAAELIMTARAPWFEDAEE